MDSKEKIKQERELFICHSIHLQKTGKSENTGEPFTTPRFKKPQSTTSENVNDYLKNRMRNCGNSLVYTRRYSLDS